MVKHGAIQRTDASSNLSRPLHFSRCNLSDVSAFVKETHYAHSIPAGITHSYSLRVGGVLHGSALFGYGAGNPRAYWGYPNCLFRELTRFVLDDSIPRNGESLFLGWCLRTIAHSNTELIAAISYADPAHGHSGVIYRATNWRYLGEFKAHRGTGRGPHSPIPKHKFVYVFPGKRGR